MVSIKKANGNDSYFPETIAIFEKGVDISKNIKLWVPIIKINYISSSSFAVFKFSRT